MNNQAELISIGSELLNGRTRNALGQILGKTLTKLGLRLIRDTTIPDDFDLIQSTVEEALNRTDMVFVSGGLGPTMDDITRDAISALLDQKVIMDSDTVKEITRRSAARGHIMTEAALRQALVLEGAEVLANAVGSAPGQKIALLESKFLFIMPGPPVEFSAILEDNVVPWLQGRFLDAKPTLVREIHTRGIIESDIVTLIESANFSPWDIEMGFYPGDGRVDIRLAAAPKNRFELEEAEESLRKILDPFTIEDDSLSSEDLDPLF